MLHTLLAQAVGEVRAGWEGDRCHGCPGAEGATERQGLDGAHVCLAHSGEDDLKRGLRARLCGACEYAERPKRLYYLLCKTNVHGVPCVCPCHQCLDTYSNGCCVVERVLKRRGYAR